jgi:lysophospholipase L1-like esterase
MLSACRPLLLVSLFTLLNAFALAAEPALHKGERIVFLGDSITEAGNEGPHGYVYVIRKELKDKHPDLASEVIGAGVSGNKVPDLQRRLEKDVLSRKPTLVVIYIGINDVWHGENDPAKGTSKEKYQAGLKDVIGRIQAAGARVLLCTPSVIGEKTDASNKNDARLDEYSQLSRDVAKELKVPVCDLRKAFLGYLKDHKKENREAGVLTSDGVHLSEAGNAFVAKTILERLGVKSEEKP